MRPWDAEGMGRQGRRIVAMDDDSRVVEQKLENALASSVPPNLRDIVLRQVRRELAAARWDRRLGRAAAALLVVGIGLNALMAIGVGANRTNFSQRGRSLVALVETAAAVAEATDAETGRRFVRHMAALGGWALSEEQTAALDAAVVDSHNGRAG